MTEQVTAPAHEQPSPRHNPARRRAMLEAAAALINERGFGETRIADVAQRAGTSTGLVMYYFGTRDQLLVEALRHSEEAFYEQAAALLEQLSGTRQRLIMLVEWSCLPVPAGEVSGAWGLWLDVWATAFRHSEVADGRLVQDQRWRDLVERIVLDAAEAGQVRRDIDARRFVLTFTTLLDGLATQVALRDPEVTPEVAYDIAMTFVDRELDLEPEPT